MSRAPKVWAWQGFRREAPRHNQTREICCAPSRAAAARAYGETEPLRLFNLGESSNPEELEVARSEPGTVFWRPLDANRPYTWRAVKKEKVTP